jgi:hypothetical protein
MYAISLATAFSTTKALSLQPSIASRCARSLFDSISSTTENRPRLYALNSYLRAPVNASPVIKDVIITH